MTTPKDQNNKPWLASVATATQSQRALVVGAGMAGAATARALAQRGWQVTIVDRQPQPAAEASGNPQGMLYIRLSANPTPLTQLLAQGYRYTLDLLGEAPAECFDLCGLIQLPDSDKERRRQQKLIAGKHYPELFQPMTAAQLSELAGFSIDQEGLYFPEGGWLQPPLFVRWLLDHPNITFQGNTHVIGLERQDDIWHATLERGEPRLAEVVVIACGHHSCALQQTAHLPLKGIRGQTTSIPATDESLKLRTVICEDGYIAPAHNGRHTLGATFQFNDPDGSVRLSDHWQNLENIASFASGVADALGFDRVDSTQLTGKAAYRCTTPDYLPMVGPVLDEPEFLKRFAALGKNAKATIDAPVPWLTGIYINTGHGSRGLITAPLAGEQLAREICGEQSCLPDALRAELHPGRFPARTLIRTGNKKR